MRRQGLFYFIIIMGMACWVAAAGAEPPALGVNLLGTWQGTVKITSEEGVIQDVPITLKIDKHKDGHFSGMITFPAPCPGYRSHTVGGHFDGAQGKFLTAKGPHSLEYVGGRLKLTGGCYKYIKEPYFLERVSD